MKQTISNASQFRDAFRAAGRQDQFSYEALGLLFDYLEDVHPDYELDVIALCCEYACETWKSVASDYDIDVDGVIDDDEGKEIVRDWLNEHTSIIGETDAGFVYCSAF
jgi:hypothetical protein